MLQTAHLGLKFFLELCAVASSGYWAYQAADQLPLRVLFGLAAAAISVVGWGVFLAVLLFAWRHGPVPSVFDGARC
jgi:hypothetical protein